MTGGKPCTRSFRARTTPGFCAVKRRRSLRRSRFLAGTAALAAASTARAAAEALPAARIELGDEVFLRGAWRELNGRTIGLIAQQGGGVARLQMEGGRGNPLC